jgi:hypothetical protein
MPDYQLHTTRRTEENSPPTFKENSVPFDKLQQPNLGPNDLLLLGHLLVSVPLVGGRGSCRG